jgi:hypothetical protein
LLAQNRIGRDLAQAMVEVRLRDSGLSRTIRECCTRRDVKPAADYRFEKLELAIRQADELVNEAAELIALGKEANHEVVIAITYVVVGLVQICEASLRLKGLACEVCDAIAQLPEIGGTIEWDQNTREGLYSAALWARSPADASVYSILEKVVRI